MTQRAPWGALTRAIEGLVAKGGASLYESGPTRRWLKVKQKGWTTAPRERLPPDRGLLLWRAFEFASKQRLPTISWWRGFPEAGGPMSYGVDFVDVYRNVPAYVDKILKGAKPGDLPLEQPRKFELVINLKTAKALGLTIPQPLLLQADQVIE